MTIEKHLQNGLDTKVEKSRKQMKERKNRAKKVRGVKKVMIFIFAFPATTLRGSFDFGSFILFLCWCWLLNFCRLRQEMPRRNDLLVIVPLSQMQKTFSMLFMFLWQLMQNPFNFGWVTQIIFACLCVSTQKLSEFGSVPFFSTFSLFYNHHFKCCDKDHDFC